MTEDELELLARLDGSQRLVVLAYVWDDVPAEVRSAALREVFPDLPCGVAESTRNTTEEPGTRGT